MHNSYVERCEIMAKNKITAGVSASCGYPETPEVFVEKLCKAGVKKIELFVNCEAETRPEYVREIKKILDGEGAKCISLHPYTCAINPSCLFHQEFFCRYRHSRNF